MIHDRGAGAYTRTQVTTTTNQRELIVMAYDGVLRFLAQAREHMVAQEIEPTFVFLTKARAVIEELATTLNKEEGGEIAKNLWNLYIHFLQRLTEASFTKDPGIIDSIVPAIRELREGWSNLEIPKDDAKAQALNRRVPPTEESHRLSVSG